MTTHKPIQGACYMLLSALCFAGINNTVQLIHVTYHIPSTTVACLQYALALLLIFPWLWKRGVWQALGTQRIGLHITRVFFAVVGLQLWYWALAYPVPLWQGIGLLMLSPIFTTIGSRLVLHETVGYERWLATIIGFCGASLILQPWAEHFYWGSVLPVGAAFFWSCSSITTKKLVKTEKTTTLLIYLLLLTTPFNIIAATHNGLTPIEPIVWVFIIGASILTALAQFSIVRAYTVADASYIQPFDNVKLPLNVALGFWVFGTVPPGRLWVGAACIMLSAAFMVRHEVKRIS